MKKRFPKLGQHFLTSPAIAKAVATAGKVAPGETVLEIGPGKGMLTRELLAMGARVVAVEKDPAMVAVLKRDFANEILRTDLQMIEGDAREFALDAKRQTLKTSYKVIANIPYYITGELLRMFLTTEHQPTTIVFLVQKEVAERIARSKKESLLSLSVKVYGTPRYVRTVKAGSFSPPPSVDSAILAIDDISRKNFGTTIYGSTLEERFFELLHAGFGQKRKTLVGNLKRAGLYRDDMHLDPKIRAEDVPLEQWLKLARA
jgi:16S rRNA (adenine1518-N6/adenine1519-N6)-dimethyltransferase